MTDEFINLKDSQNSDAIFCYVVYVGRHIVSLKYKHNGMYYNMQIPRTEANSDLKERDEVEMQLFRMKEIEDE